MIQTDEFGGFNFLILSYSSLIAESITWTANNLRINLLRVSQPIQFYDTEAYINDVVSGYRFLARSVRK